MPKTYKINYSYNLFNIYYIENRYIYFAQNYAKSFVQRWMFLYLHDKQNKYNWHSCTCQYEINTLHRYTYYITYIYIFLKYL